MYCCGGVGFGEWSLVFGICGLGFCVWGSGSGAGISVEVTRMAVIDSALPLSSELGTDKPVWPWLSGSSP